MGSKHPLPRAGAGTCLQGSGGAQQPHTLRPPSSTPQIPPLKALGPLLRAVTIGGISAMHQAVLWFLETHH